MTFLAVGLPVIVAGNGEWIVERPPRILEAHAVAHEVRSSLLVVPLEFVIAH
jgi:hypothetical protein